MLFIFNPVIHVISLSFVHYIFLFLLYNFLVSYVYICYFFPCLCSLLDILVSYFFVSILFLYFFVLASKRNNYNDSEMNALIVFNFVRLMTRDQHCDVHAVRTRYLA